MKMTTKKIEKRIYLNPTIEVIKLDNEISLALSSLVPPDGPGETFAPEYINNNPFRDNMA